jgi:hypothetical protein
MVEDRGARINRSSRDEPTINCRDSDATIFSVLEATDRAMPAASRRSFRRQVFGLIWTALEALMGTNAISIYTHLTGGAG